MKPYKIFLSFAISIIMLSCSMTHSLRRQTPTADIQLPSNGQAIESPEIEDIEQAVERVRHVAINEGKDSVYLAIGERDSVGEVTLWGDDIEEVYVVAKAKNIVERNGEVSIDFIVVIPAQLQHSTWGLELTPVIETNGSEEALQPLSVRGELFSEIQKRQYWQMNRYLNRILSDTSDLSSSTSLAAKYYKARNTYLDAELEHKADKLEAIYKQTVSFPYLTDSRLDSVLIRKEQIQYYYTQKYRPTKNVRRLQLHFHGKVDAIDRSSYSFSNTDTLSYTITSMLSLLDETPRYMSQIVSKYVQVHDRNYVTFYTGRSEIIDTLGNNHAQLDKIERLMDTLINQYQFFVDSVTITASSSPDGSKALNNTIASARARSIKQHLVRKFGRQIDTLIKTRSIGEDWTLLKRLMRHNSDMPHWQQITEMIDQSRDFDVTEPQIRQKYPKDYAFMKEILYPQLRAVDFRYNLRRVDMVQDTIWLTVLDTTYLRGVQQLRDRDYVGALNTLNDYKCQNLAIVMVSLGADERALEILQELPVGEKNAQTDYLMAIVLSRLNRPQEGLECYLEALRKEPVLKYRGNLDPEIQILYRQNNVKSSF